MVSVSDETFVKLLLVNSCRQWEDINKKIKNSFRGEKRNSKKKGSSLQPRYTSYFSTGNKRNINLTRVRGEMV